MSLIANTAKKQSLDIRTGMSKNPDPFEAVKELCSQISQPDIALAVIFISPEYDLEKLEPELNKRFPDCPVIGCTTSGEITPHGYSENSITGFSISNHNTIAKVYTIEQIKDLTPSSVKPVGDDVRKQIEMFKTGHPGAHEFTLFFVDGMSVAEEKTVAFVHQALKNVPLVGGSAGDNLRFNKTWVFSDGNFRSNAAVMALVCTTLPFETFKTQHFLPTETKMVITEADPSTRTVYEINGLPAADEYARLIGINPNELVPEVFSRYPIMLRIGGEYYVRSLQKKNPDGSLTFYCAIDNGLVLTFARGVDIVENLKSTLDNISSKIRNPQLLITCECVLRRLEVLQDDLTCKVNDLLVDHKAIGFHSYGEQFNSIHVNQTFSGVMIGQA